MHTADGVDLDAELANADRLQPSWAGPGTLVLGVRTYLGWADVVAVTLAVALLDAAFLVTYLLSVGTGANSCYNDFCAHDYSGMLQATVVRWICFGAFALLTCIPAVLIGRRLHRCWQLFVTAQILMLALVSGLCSTQIAHYRHQEQLQQRYSGPFRPGA